MQQLSAKLTYLKLVLEHLHIPVDVSSLESRICMQKGVYLAQRLGGAAKLYEFRWDLHGPYSPVLAEDYNVLAVSAKQPFPELRIDPSAQRSLERLRLLMQHPSSIGASDWLELVGSVYFLREELRYSSDEILTTLNEQKYMLVGHYESCIKAIDLFLQAA